MKHELEMVKWAVIPITAYRGCLVTKIIGGYTVFGKKFKTPKEVDEEITKSYTSVGNSIKQSLS